MKDQGLGILDVLSGGGEEGMLLNQGQRQKDGEISDLLWTGTDFHLSTQQACAQPGQ